MGVRQALVISELRSELERTIRLNKELAKNSTVRGSVIIGLEQQIAEFYDAAYECLKQDVKDLKKKVEQIECPHHSTEIRYKNIPWMDLGDNISYEKTPIKVCKTCGHQEKVSQTKLLAHHINEYAENMETRKRSFSDEALRSIKSAVERLKEVIREAEGKAPDA